MFLESVVPLLKSKLPLEEPFVSSTLRTAGIGESLVQEIIHEPLAGLVSAGLEVGYCARPWQVDVRVAARGSEAVKLVSQGEAIVGKLLQKNLFANGEEELASVIVNRLAKRRETLVLAESCTGGWITNQLTNVPGSSAVVLAGLVTYGNDAKMKFLGVEKSILDEHGAVSEQVVRQMAEGARKALKADYAIAVTGIAGPGGGTPAKPVGTVYIALAGPFETVVKRNSNPYDRETFKLVTALQALEMLRRKALTV
jgi:nicotinamide-nucleotide amidase